MSETVSLLNELIDLSKIMAPVLTLLLIVAALCLRVTRRVLRGPRKVAFAFLACLTSLAYAMGAGSCVLGGFLQGSAICSHHRRSGPALDAVADFFEIQAVYFVLFLLTFFLATLLALALVPGNVEPWQRFLFLLTLGKHGAWRPLDLTTAKLDERERSLLKAVTQMADPALLATVEEGLRLKKEMENSLVAFERDVTRGIRLMNWLFAITFPILSLGFSIPFVVGALTQQTLSFGGTAAMVSLEMQPGLFWMNMVLSVFFAGLFGFGAIQAIRTLRSPKANPNPTVESDARNGARGSL